MSEAQGGCLRLRLRLRYQPAVVDGCLRCNGRCQHGGGYTVGESLVPARGCGATSRCLDTYYSRSLPVTYMMAPTNQQRLRRKSMGGRCADVWTGLSRG